MQSRHKPLLAKVLANVALKIQVLNNFKFERKDIAAKVILAVKEDPDNTPFAEKGGLAPIYQLFGSQMDEVMEELNETLVA